MQQKGQRIRPKIPKRAQQGGKQGEKQRRAAHKAQQHVDPHLPGDLPQRKQEQCGGGQEAVEAVQQPRQPGQAQPCGPRKIVDETRGKAQQDGLEKHRHLLIDEIPHIIRIGGAASRRGLLPAPRRSWNRSSRPHGAPHPPARAARYGDFLP